MASSLRGDTLAAAQSYGEELNEEDVWGGSDESEVDDRDWPGDDVSANVEVTAGRVINRAGWDSSATVTSLSKNRGLSALAAGGIHGSGQGPGGAAGDILGSAINITPSVFIRRIPSKADVLLPMRRASAPVNVPDWGKITGTTHRGHLQSLVNDDDEDGTVVPPHELIARECAKSVTFSVLEGVGRTLRGRDLDHVRTEVLRKTGFLDI